jgi:hypothetical protein
MSNVSLPKKSLDKILKRSVELYLDRHGTEGYEDFKRFLMSKGVRTDCLELREKGRNKLRFKSL